MGGVSRREFVIGSVAFPVLARLPVMTTLAAPAFPPLPLGAVRPRGSARRQLERQRDGLTGNAERLLPAAMLSAWRGEAGGEDWEKGPYYLKGLVPLAHLLDDAELRDRAMRWIDPILASGRPDGNFGPLGNDDHWPRMVVTHLLRDHFEATGDERVLPFLTAYYRFLRAELPRRPLRDWGRARAGDELEGVLWLFDRTGEPALLDLARTLLAQALPWGDLHRTNGYLEPLPDFHPKHNVNVPQGLKLSPLAHRLNGERRGEYAAAVASLDAHHGTPFGMWAGSEMLSGRSIAAGVETCSTVEFLLSADVATRILGDAEIADRAELAALNALPAATSRDFRAHVYYTLAGDVHASEGTVGHQDDHGNDRVPGPISGYPCCCYNLHFGFPKWVKNAWGATTDGGRVLHHFVPCEVDAPGGRIVCETEYPNDESVRLTVDAEGTWPLMIRIPGWCREPSVRVNGSAVSAPPGEYLELRREWRRGDRVEIDLPMTIETLPEVGGAISVRRGPVTYALPLTEEWRSVKEGPGGFDTYEVRSESPWNYALRPEAGFRFEGGAVIATARRVPEWTARADGRLPLDPPVSPLAAEGPDESVRLVPFGETTLRIAQFPVVGVPVPATREPRTDRYEGDFPRRWWVYRGARPGEGTLRLPWGSKAILAAPMPDDLRVETTVTPGRDGDAGVVVRVTGASLGPDDYRGYYAGVDAARGQVVLGRSDDRWTELASVAMPISGSVRLSLEAVGDRLRVFVDGAPVLEARDGTYASGLAGLRSYSPHALFGPFLYGPATSGPATSGPATSGPVATSR